MTHAYRNMRELKPTRFTKQGLFYRLPFLFDLEKKLSFFLDNGLLSKAPTKWQILQAEIEMMPVVAFPYSDDDGRYPTPWGKYKVWRTIASVAYTFGGHFRIGAGLLASEKDVRKHLLIVHHFGDAVYDLQLLQTFPKGLDNLERRIHILNTPLEKREGDQLTSPRSRLRLEKRFLEMIVPEGYHGRLLGQIEKAKNLDYDPCPPNRKPEYWNLVSFMEHCATNYAPRWFSLRAPRDALKALQNAYTHALEMWDSYKNRKLLKEKETA